MDILDQTAAKLSDLMDYAIENYKRDRKKYPDDGCSDRLIEFDRYMLSEIGQLGERIAYVYRVGTSRG